MRLTILALAVALTAAAGRADDKKPAGPVQVTITGKAKYALQTGGLTPAEYKKRVDAAANAKEFGGRPPAAPAVELAVEVKNTSDKPVQVWVKGDPVVLELTAKGPGAVNLTPLLAFTQEFRLPTAVEVGPGKTHTIPVKSLVSGFRGASRYSYWTEPGEYELTATFKTGVSPAPPGSQPGEEGFGMVELKSAPFKVTVEGK